MIEFAPDSEKYTGLLGATLVSMTTNSPYENADRNGGYNTQKAVGAVAAEEHLWGDNGKNTIRLPRQETGDWTFDLGFFVSELFTTRFSGLFIVLHLLFLPHLN
jgi:hypothetical protein